MAKETVYHPEGLNKTSELKLHLDKAGLWTGSQVYTCMKRDLQRVMPRPQSSHPEVSFMTVDEVSLQFLPAKRVQITAHYAGYSPATAGDNLAEYSMDISVSDEPLESHPRYEDLDPRDIAEAAEFARNPPREEDGGKVKEIDLDDWDALKVELYEKIQGGFEAYRDPKMTWTKRWVDNSAPQEGSEVGKISEPDGNVPAVPGDRNWLNVGLSMRQRGRVFENEVRWELSGRGGWDDVIYGA